MHRKTVLLPSVRPPDRRSLRQRKIRRCFPLFVSGVLVVLACFATAALRAQMLWDMTPTNLATWADLDGAVANTYEGFTHEIEIFPPGPWRFGFAQGYVTFSADGELAALTNLCVCSTQYNVPTWHMTTIETQTTPRAWVYIGANDAAFRTNECPSAYDPIQWVRDVFQYDAPSYLDGTNRDQWYADRDRSRFTLTSTFVNSNDWPTLQAAVQAAATNNPPPGPWSPAVPADSNNMAILNLPSSGAMDLWIYTPAARPVAILTSTNLVEKKWTVLGNFGSTPPFTSWHAMGSVGTAFFRSGYTDVDSDGDGIPDAIEMFVTGTDPYTWDSAGTSLGDYERFFIYGLDPTSRNLNGDGMDDDEAILAGLDPNAWNTGAGTTSIRYYYDADDRVAGTFSGSPASAARYRISPAGNHASTVERSAP